MFVNIKKPIFILGSGSSGTTILYELLALHPEVCWFSNLTQRFPGFRLLPISHRLMDAPLIGRHLKQRMMKQAGLRLRPAEGDNIYGNYCGFLHERKMGDNDLTDDIQTKFREIIRGHLLWSGKPRFLNKQTANTQRIRVIHKMFPDALFIHIIRDGRAVANSLLNTEWWNRTMIWWLGATPAQWKEMGREPIELSALHWQKDVHEILQNKYLFEDRYLELRYEDLVDKPREMAGKIISFCGLKESQRFLESLPKKLVNMNYKWKERLNGRQKQIITGTIGSFLTKLGYHVQPQ